MKNKIFSTVIFLSTLFLFTTTAYADQYAPKQSLAEAVYYGQIDAIYPEELRIIIEDRSFNYNNQSLFEEGSGNTILNIGRSIRPGLYAKYHTLPTTFSDFLLIDLTIISEKQFNDAQNEPNND